MRAATAPGYRHHALLYGSPAQLVDAAVPFLAEGLAAGEPAVLSCRAEHNDRLAAALGRDDRILALAQEDIYLRTAHAVASYRRTVRQQVAAGVPRVRLVGESASTTPRRAGRSGPTTRPSAMSRWARCRCRASAPTTSGRCPRRCVAGSSRPTRPC